VVIIVKAGGRALQNNLENIAKGLARAGASTVFVHGGGDVVSELSRRMGVEPLIVTSPSGIRSRYTDERELEVYVMAMAGKLNKEVVAAVQRFGGRAVGLSGVDGGLLIAERKSRIIVVDDRGRRRLVPGGYTGSIRSVNAALLRGIMEAGYTPVVAPLALGTGGEILNVDGDQAASWIARALAAEMIVFLSDVEGVVVEGCPVERLTPDEAYELAGKIGPGMNRKLALASQAVKAGVGMALITSGLGDDPFSRIRELQGTLIVSG